MRILLTGTSGQVGGALRISLGAIGTVVALDRDQLDLSLPDTIPLVLSEANLYPRYRFSSILAATCDIGLSESFFALPRLAGRSRMSQCALLVFLRYYSQPGTPIFTDTLKEVRARRRLSAVTVTVGGDTASASLHIGGLPSRTQVN